MSNKCEAETIRALDASGCRWGHRIRAISIAARADRRLEVAQRMADALKDLRELCAAVGLADARGEWTRVMSGAKDALAEWEATR